MVLFADRLAGYGIPVTMVIADVPSSTSSSETIAGLSASFPSIPFQLLPAATTTRFDDPNADPFLTLITDLRTSTPHLLAILRSIPSIKAIVLDFFCGCAIDAIRDNIGLPAYLFYPSGATPLAIYLHIPTMESDVSFRDMDRHSLLHFPGVHPIPVSDMPEVMFRPRTDEQYKENIVLYEQILKAKGLLANTFEWLEPAVVKAMQDGSPCPGKPLPRLFCIGPLVGSEKGCEVDHECLTWLDTQPARSVVFLGFGSASSVSAEQLKEIAVGLERSGHAFLWAVRAPVAPDVDSTRRFAGRGEAALEALLPVGFLGRTRGRGMVVSTWAPQAEVLRHAATGAFVTHCGWNSTMEVVVAGVPMVCWPMYAEQRMNKVVIAEGLKLGVVMRGYDEGLVTAQEVEEKVKLVMGDSEEGRELRERMVVAKDMAAAAVESGGSSETALVDFLNNI